jgi:Ca2+-transporting ATPase
MSDAELSACIEQTTVFARIMPEQKLRIVETFKAKGEVVAMTGDGVNDAPSLKAAHIGIAMGNRGTDVAREAASIVLLQDDFISIVAGVRLGRRIYDNLQKAMRYILAIHVPIAGLALLPLLLGWPLLFMPVHIAFLELVIDPVCSLVFEAEREEKDLMNRPPRAATASLFSARLVLFSLAEGALLLLGIFGLFAVLLKLDVPVNEVRAITFTALVAGNFALILVTRAAGVSLLDALRRPNPVLWLIGAATAAMLAASLYIEPLRAIFQFGRLDWTALLLAVATGAVGVLILAGAKYLLLEGGKPG